MTRERPKHLYWIFLIVVVICGLAFLLDPECGYSHELRVRKTTGINLRQSALAFEKFLDKTGGKYPRPFKTAEDYAAAVIRFGSVEFLRSDNPSRAVFLPNPNLEGLSRTSIANPERTILAYESSPWPNGTRGVAYCDAHVEFISSFSKQELIVGPTKVGH